MSDHTTGKALQGGLHAPSAPSPRTVKFLPLLMLTLFLLAAFIIKDRHSDGTEHSYIRATTEGGVSVTILDYGLADPAKCRAKTQNMVQAMQSACPICQVVEASCKTSLNSDELDWLGDAPLDQPSARSGRGVILYDAPNQSEALAACRMSEATTADSASRAPIRCFAPGEHRAFPAEQQAKIDASRRNFDAVVLVTLCLGTLITSLVLLAKSRSPSATRSDWVAKLTIAGIDAFVMLAAYAVLGFPDFDEPLALQQFDRKNLLTHGALILIAVSWFWVVLEHYGRRRPFWDELREVFRTLWILLLLAGAAVFYLGLDSGRGLTLLTWASLFIALPLGRATARQLLDATGLWRRPAVIIGTGENARETYLAIKNEAGLGYQIQGFVPTVHSDPTLTHIRIGHEQIPVIPGSDPVRVVEALGNPQIIVALETTSTPEKQRMLMQLTTRYKNIHFIPSVRGVPLFGTQLSHFFSHDMLFLTVRNNLSRRSYRWLKRGFDLIVSVAVLALLSPVFLVLSALIRRSGGSAFYGHTRVGQHGTPFKCLKFRSMRPDADVVLKHLLDTDPQARAEWERDFKLKNDPRITAVGHFLRKTSLDELPQLINVIKGDMSLVGPRPVVFEELERYGDQAALYLQCLPGVTGLWQVSGRNDTSYAERVSLDAWYVQNWSLWYDIAILFKTVDVVVNRRGAY